MVDSPVYAVLPDLERPVRRRAAAIPATNAAVQVKVPDTDTYAAKLELARDAMANGSFAFAKQVLNEIYRDQIAPGADGFPKPATAAIVQELALATYRAGEESAKTRGINEALSGYAHAEELLQQLDVYNTTDPGRFACGATSINEGPRLPLDQNRNDQATSTMRLTLQNAVS